MTSPTRATMSGSGVHRSRNLNAPTAGVLGVGTSSGRAFTVIDLLVSIAIIAVLIAILVPTLAGARELTRRVVCASNARQHGLAMAMYQQDYAGELPASRFAEKYSTGRGGQRPQDTMIVRTESVDEWDGLGVLYATDYLNQPQVFYCPSHNGEHPWSKYAPTWAGESAQVLVINYQYRAGLLELAALAGSERPALVSDGMRTQADFSHRLGANILRSDFSVSWYNDPSGQIVRQLPVSVDDAGAAEKVQDAWGVLDGILGASSALP